MELEYSKTGENHLAYTFSQFEKKVIANALRPFLKKYDKMILKVENDPDNEGQATFSSRIDELYREKQCVELIIKHFDK